MPGPGGGAISGSGQLPLIGGPSNPNLQKINYPAGVLESGGQLVAGGGPNNAITVIPAVAAYQIPGPGLYITSNPSPLAPLVITLPPAGGTGIIQEVTIMNANTNVVGGGGVTIVPSGSDKIFAGPGWQLSGYSDSVTLVADGHFSPASWQPKASTSRYVAQAPLVALAAGAQVVTTGPMFIPGPARELIALTVFTTVVVAGAAIAYQWFQFDGSSFYGASIPIGRLTDGFLDPPDFNHQPSITTGELGTWMTLRLTTTSAFTAGPAQAGAVAVFY